MDAEEIEELSTRKMSANEISTVDDDGEMTLRERWRRTMYYQRVARLPNMEFGYWNETLPAWREQGLPPHIVDERSAYAFFGIENWGHIPANTGLLPGFPYEVLEETEKYRTYRDGNRAVCQINTEGHQSIPHYLEFGIKNREDWLEFKERLDPDTPGRIPENWDELVPALNKRDYPAAINIGSMVGIPRNWIGFENIALMIYDEPELLEEIVETLCTLVCSVLERVLVDVTPDFGAGWEDICFNSGPIVGRDFMEQVVAPRYKRITDLLNLHGCHLAWTDCDGNLTPISDIFLDNGINVMFPVEVNGGTDPVHLREKHGKAMRFQGGFCKMKFLEGPQAVEEELQRLKPVVDEGGFVLGVDHRVQADAPLATYMYYMKRKRELFNVGGEPQYDESKVGLRKDGTVELPDF